MLDTDGLYLSKGEFLIVGMGCCPTNYGCFCPGADLADVYYVFAMTPWVNSAVGKLKY